MSTLVTRHFRIHNARNFVESFSETNPDRYYFFIGKNYAWANAIITTGTVKTTAGSNTIVGSGTLFTTQIAVGDTVRITGQTNNHVVHSIPSAQTIVTTSSNYNTITAGANLYIRKAWSEFSPPDAIDSYQNTHFDVWRNMMSLKRITTSDISHCTPRYNWSNNTPYVEWDDRDPNIFSKQFYVLTEDNRVYKCIDNNRNANSTIKPIGESSSIIELDDGYRWKYMYTITSASALKFLTSSYIPVQTLESDDSSSQWDVQQNASNGSINHIKLIANGSGFLSTTNTFVSVVNSTVLTLSSDASGVDDIYNGSAIYISQGLGATQIRKIVNYVGANNTLTVNTALSVLPNTSSRYIISPLVTIRGDASGAKAYVANTFEGQVRQIRIIDSSYNYSTANVTITANVGSGATARPIISPTGGHGYDVIEELNGTYVMLNTKLESSESNTFTTNNDYRTVGLIVNPLLANSGLANVSVIDQSTRITVSGVLGDFRADEIITGLTSGAKARLIYFANTNTARSDGVLKVTRVTTNGTGGGFVAGETVKGSDSTIEGYVESVNPGALKPYSGILIYRQSRTPVTRADGQTEDFKITINF